MPSGVYTRVKRGPMPEWHRLKLRGKRPNVIPWNKGIKATKEEAERLRSLAIGNSFRRGIKNTPETLKRISIAHKGKKLTEEHKAKIRAACKGDKCYKWIKDRNLLKKSEKKHLDSRYREWSLGVKNRDKWLCRFKNRDCSGRLESHHIFSWREYPELRYAINNGITLCHAHHPRARAEEKRLIPIFIELVSVSKE